MLECESTTPQNTGAWQGGTLPPPALNYRKHVAFWFNHRELIFLYFMETLVLNGSTSFAELATENGIKFGENYAKLPLGTFTISFTSNAKKQLNTYFADLTDEQKEKASEFNLLVECTIEVTKNGKKSILSSGFLRINSALKKCEVNKTYEVTTILDSFDKKDKQGNTEKQAYNKVVGLKEIE